MAGYVVRRVFMGIIVVIIVTILVFLLIRLLPGDPLLMYLTQQQFRDTQFDPAQLAQLQAKYGLDKPLPMQYISWIADMFHGDLGESINLKQPVSKLIAQRMPVTLHLSIIGAIFATIVGIGFGIICAIRRGTWLDTVLTFLANIGITIPSFWAAILLIYLFGLKLHWVPIAGYTSPFEDFWLNTRQIILPIFCMSLFGLASNTRLTRSCMLEVIAQDYIRTAWAKGLKERVIILRHTVKNGLIPLIANMGFLVAGLFGGSVIIETLFNINGVGRLLTTALLGQDYMIVQASTLLFVGLITFSNIVVDISYGWLDPRIRYD
jgi:peptide/nickel transport system permease protein